MKEATQKEKEFNLMLLNAELVKSKFWVEVYRSGKKYDEETLRRVIKLLERKYERHQRENGVFYTVYAMDLAIRVMQMGEDEELVIGALLHNLLDNTTTIPIDLEVSWGFRVRDMLVAFSPLKFVGWRKYVVLQREERGDEFLERCKNTDARFLKLCIALYDVEKVETQHPMDRITFINSAKVIWAPYAREIGREDIAQKLEALYASRMKEWKEMRDRGELDHDDEEEEAAAIAAAKKKKKSFWSWW